MVPPYCSSYPTKPSVSMTALLGTPAKSSSAHSTPQSSPRLRTPRGSSPRSGGGVWVGLLKNSTGILLATGVVVIWLLRPSMDIDSNHIVTFIDPNSAPLELSRFFLNASSYSDPAMYSMSIDQTIKSIQDTLSDSSSSLSSYDPSRDPLISIPTSEVTQQSRPSKPLVDVHLIFEISDAGLVGPQSKFLLDGLERSPFTNLVAMTFLDPKLQGVKIGDRWAQTLVFVVDWGSMQRDCHRLQRVLENLNRMPEDYVLLVDYTGSTRQSSCEEYFQDDSFVRLAKRSIVSDRHYDHIQKTISSGYISENTANVMQASLVVRERFVAALFNSSITKSPIKASRRTDICFFWKHGDYSHYGFWRRDVSNFVKSLGKRYKLSTHVDTVVNDEEGMAAGNIQLNYVQELLRCKIVVIAQRDEWEDHYRLYESLASGALVLTDPMLAPPDGLTNTTNILIYDNLKSLERLVRYYLKHSDQRKSIARRGMEWVLGRHRSWHRVEQLLFGQPLYQVDAPFDKPPEKMTRPELSLMDADIALPT